LFLLRLNSTWDQLVLGGDDDLSLEWLGVDLVVNAAILASVPLGELIKDDIATDMISPCP
jgi:hypothetical protein